LSKENEPTDSQSLVQLTAEYPALLEKAGR